MPADFTAQDSARADLANLFGFATGFGTRVKDFMNATLGVNNPFGTAATLDAGTTDGDAPILNADNNISQAQMPAATTDADGILHVAGSHTAPDTRAFNGKSFPVGITASAVNAAVEPFMHAIAASGMDMRDLPRGVYGRGTADNPLMASFILPREACMIFISPNGGRNSTFHNNDGGDIGIVDSAGNMIFNIRGGEAGLFSRTFPNGRREGDLRSDYSVAASDTIDIIEQATLDMLSLRAGVVMKGMGAQGTSGGRGSVDIGSEGVVDYTVRYGDAQPADLLFAVKDDTPSPVTWLTDNPTPPYIDNVRAPRRDVALVRPSESDTLGYAFYIRLR